MVLVDTNVWIDHLRSGDPLLTRLLEAGDVYMHEYVIGELACGTLKNRKKILVLLEQLPRASTATHDEVMFFLERQQLMSRGLGYIDVHLLASVALETGLRLLTRDARLRTVAMERKCAYLK